MSRLAQPEARPGQGLDGNLDAAVGRLDEGQRALVAEFAGVIAGEGQPIPGLTPQESRLVRALEAGRGRVLSYTFLADAIAHDPLQPPALHTVRMVLCHLRQKRPDIGRSIVTVHGAGLKWTGPGARG